MFLGTHFFNPPRYMKLLEIIPSPRPQSVVEKMAQVGEKIWEGVVYAKDTPNFIGNRVGAFATAITMRTAIEDGYRIEEVDQITGLPWEGRSWPRSSSVISLGWMSWLMFPKISMRASHQETRENIS